MSGMETTSLAVAAAWLAARVWPKETKGGSAQRSAARPRRVARKTAL